MPSTRCFISSALRHFLLRRSIKFEILCYHVLSFCAFFYFSCLSEEYLILCRKYPGAHIKTVRSHLMKFFYKYFLKHPDLRERAASTNSYDGFEEIIREMKLRVVDDSEYDEVCISETLLPTIFIIYNHVFHSFI